MSELHYKNKRAAEKKDEENGLFENFSMKIPSSLLEILKDKSFQLGIPVSRLVSIAVDNEFETKTPFNYPIPEEDIDCDVSEGGVMEKVLTFFETSKSRFNKQTLLILRRNLGIESKNTIIQVLYLLVRYGKLQEFEQSRKYFNYPKGTKSYGIPRKNYYKKQFKGDDR